MDLASTKGTGEPNGSRDAWGDDRLGTVRRRLRELGKLDTDWDSYGGMPPTPSAIDAAFRFVAELEARTAHRAHPRVLPTSISALPSGGLELEWQTPRDVIAIDIGPHATWGYLRKVETERGTEYEEGEDVSRETLLHLITEVVAPQRAR
jgi:hypothetical protein